MRHYQDTETGIIFAFEDFEDPFIMKNRNIPKTLRTKVVEKPSDNHVWYHGDWVSKESVPINYTPPISSVPVSCPAWTVFMFSPGTLIIDSPDDKIEISLDQINTNTYDGRYFSKIVSHLIIPGSNQPALITRDGAIMIPRNDLFSSQDKAINLINRIAGALFIGGVIVPAVDYALLEFGTLLEGGKGGFSSKPSLHSNFRNNWGGIGDRIALLNIKYIEINRLHAAYEFGNQILGIIKELTPEFLVRGYSSLQDRNLNDALSNLWIIVEQLTHHICKIYNIKFKTNNNYTVKIKVLLNMLKDREILSDGCFRALDDAREVRNNMIHEGKSVGEIVIIEELWINLFKLFAKATGSELKELVSLTISCSNGRKNLIQKYVQIEQNLNNKNFDEWLNYQD